MRIAVFLLALLFLEAARALAAGTPSPMPSASPQPDIDVTAENDPTTRIKTYSFQAAYTGASYGPGSHQLSQIIPRVAVFDIGKSLLRISLPRAQTINGVASGISDMTVFYLFQRPVHPGAAFVGIFAHLPTASSRFFGTGKWLAGPAAAYLGVYRPPKEILGVLVQTGFSVAGTSSRSAQSAITVLPIGALALARGWSLKLPEAPWVFDLQHGASLIPLGLGIGYAFRLGGGDAILISISDDTSVVHANVVNAPKNTVRLTFSVLESSSPGGMMNRP